MAVPGPRPWLALSSAAFAVVASLTFVVAFGMTRRCSPTPAIALPPVSSSSTVVRALPNVLLAVRDLSRLETTSFHLERVIDLSEQQSNLFGLIRSEDAILLVAVGDVSAGIDLGKLRPEDVEVDAAAHGVRITLPAPELFHTALDNEKTYVHTRRTGVLARRQEQLETRARQQAERDLANAAESAGILIRAGNGARRVVEELLRSLGYRSVEVRVRGMQRE